MFFKKLDVYVLMDSKFSVLVIPITFESPLKHILKGM